MDEEYSSDDMEGFLKKEEDDQMEGTCSVGNDQMETIHTDGFNQMQGTHPDGINQMSGTQASVNNQIKGVLADDQEDDTNISGFVKTETLEPNGGPVSSAGGIITLVIENVISSDGGENENPDKEGKADLKGNMCNICGKHITPIDELIKHIETHKAKDHVEQDVNSEVVRASVKPGKTKSKNAADGPFMCKVCGERFSNKNALIKHNWIHTAEKEYRRVKDGEDVTDKIGKLPKYKCNYCGKSFNQCSSLDRHQMTHTGKEPYICKICGKGYITKNGLKYHFRGHTGEKPYKCEICGTGFRRLNQVKRHKESCNCSLEDKLSLRKEKPFSCELCGKNFARKSSLNRHIRRTACLTKDHSISTQPVPPALPVLIVCQGVHSNPHSTFSPVLDGKAATYPISGPM